MLRTTFLALSLLIFSPAVLGQTTSADARTLQALLSEVRQLRHELHAASIAAQRAQVLVYRLHAQETAVARASQRLDDHRMRLVQMDGERKHDEAQIKKYEDMKNHTQNPEEQKQFDYAISDLKAKIDASKPEEEELQAKETELEGQLQMEQAKLELLQDEMDKLDKALEDSSPQSASAPQ